MVAEFLIAHEQLVRVSAFVLVLAAMAGWEIVAPRRALSIPRARRWANNLALLLVNAVLVRLLFPAAAVGFAAFAQAKSIGLLHVWQVPEVLAMALSVVLLDLAIYVQHVVFHAIPILWRLHRVHHADLDFDVTTGTRFHPIEILLSMGIKFLLICMLGPPVLAVLVFETLLNVTAMFNHSNIRMQVKVDSLIRRVLVTPDMHRVHHSAERTETNSNFGFCFSVWDRLLGTYQPAPMHGHVSMQIGIPEFRDPKQVVSITAMLGLPFVATPRPTAVSMSA